MMKFAPKNLRQNGGGADGHSLPFQTGAPRAPSDGDNAQTGHVTNKMAAAI